MKSINYCILAALIFAGLSFSQVKYTWNGGTGSWQTSSNWNPNGIPGTADTAVVNSGTVTNDQSVTIASLFHNGGTINGIGSIIINDSLSFVAGTQGGTGTTTISSSGTGSITTTNGKTISRTFVVDGLLEVLGSGTVSFSTGAQVINNGTLDFQMNVSFGNINGAVVNNGTILNSSASGGGVFLGPLTNNGTVNVQSGELSSSGGVTGSGSFVIAEGRKFRITGGTSTLGGNSISGSGTFEIISGILNINDSTVTVAAGTTFLQSSGTVGGNGSLIINGTLNWVAGTHGGTGTTTISSTGTGSITTTNGKTITRTFVVDGLLEVQGTGTISFSTGAQVINNGTLDFQTNVSFGNISGTIVNNGTLLNSAPTGGGILPGPFTNNGTVNVQSGDLSSSGGILGGGSFVIAEARKFRITGGTSTLGGNNISGSGTFELVNGILNFSGSGVTITTGTTFLQSSGTIGGNGSLIINGTLNWVAGTHGGTGTTTISSSGIGRITATNGKVISRTFVVDGLLEVLGSGTVSFSTGAQVINNGTLDFQTNVSFGNINGTVVNNGTLLNSAATGGGILAAPFTNNGTVNVESGELSSSGGISGSGSFVIAEGRKFRITAGTSTIGGNSISGSGTFELSVGTLNLSGSVVTVASGTTFLQSSGTVGGDGSLMINGTFNWVSGTQGGTGTTTIATTAVGSLTTTNGKVISRTFVVDGLLEVLGSGTVSFSTGAQVINNGTLDFQTNVSFGNINGTIVNNGTLLNSSISGGGILAAPFTNNGVVQILSGTLSFSDTLKNNLSAEIKGVGILTTPTANRFINNGTLAPGLSPGILRINGNYLQTSNADLNIEIGGYVVGSERDSLEVTQQAQLDGTLNIQFTNAFLPQVGDVFTIMSYSSRSGQFAQINLSNNVSVQTNYLSNGLQIQITSGGSNLPPSVPVLLSPADNDTVSISSPISFLWNSSTDPDNDPITFALRIFGSGIDTTIAGSSDTTAQFNGSGILQQGNSYQWNVTASDGNLSTVSATRNFYVSSPTSVKDETIVNILPTEYSLSQNYPNPFNPNTKISWQSPVSSHQTLKIYDVLGNEVAKLVDEYREAGSYEVEFNPASSIKSPASGIYFYRLQVGSFVETKKMMLMK